jgi:hypothetical protein
MPDAHNRYAVPPGRQEIREGSEALLLTADTWRKQLGENADIHRLPPFGCATRIAPTLIAMIRRVFFFAKVPNREPASSIRAAQRASSAANFTLASSPLLERIVAIEPLDGRSQ